MNSSMQHFSVIENYEYFLVADFEGIVYLYRKGISERKNQILTHLDSSGNRLQLVPENESLVAGAYYVHGIECYSINDSSLVWKRKDLKKVQNIRKIPNAAQVACFFENRAGIILDCITGETIFKYRGVKDVYFSRFNSLCLEEGINSYKIKDIDSLKFTVEPKSFAILDATFSPTSIAISESGATVRFFSSRDGGLIGEYIPQKGYHILELSFNVDSELFIGLLWGYESAGDYYFVHISQEGEEIRKIPIAKGYVGACFFPERNSLLNADGSEINWNTGEEIFKYNFLTQT